MGKLREATDKLKAGWMSMTPKARKITSIVIGLFVLLLVARGCGKARTGDEIINDVIPVKAVKVDLRTIKDTLDYVGDIKAQEEAAIYPKVGGKIIEKVREDGAPINKGDVIAYVDRDEVGFKFEKAPVESTLTGIVGRVFVDIGSQVTPQTVIAQVEDMDNVKIDLNIPERGIPKVEVGQTAEIKVDAYPGEIFVGKVTKVSPVLDIGTRTAPIEVLISNADYRLKPGMFADTRLVVNEIKDTPVVLKEAIMGKGKGIYVYVIDNNVARQRSIKTGVREGSYYQVVDGLKRGDVVVVMGQQRLYDGSRVKVELGELSSSGTGLQAGDK